MSHEASWYVERRNGMNMKRTANERQSLAGAEDNDYGACSSVLAHRQDSSQTKGSPGGNIARSGRAPLVVILLVLILGAIAVYVMGSGESASAPNALTPELISGKPESPTAPVSVSDEKPLTTENFVPRGTRTGKRAIPQFYGRGSIRGMIAVRGDQKLPKDFTIHIGPSDSLMGREHAEAKSTPGNGAEFTFEDVSLGGYDVWIEAAGQNPRRNPILLTQATSKPYVIIGLAPTGYLDGYVTNKDGRPAQRLVVQLKSTLSDHILKTQTRGDGFYSFDDVPDGEFEILFGPLHRPLLPARSLLFQAPSMRFPQIILPPTVDILIHTTDATGKSVGEVTLSGFGSPDGRIELITDAAGLGWSFNVPPGRYRIVARTEDDLTARATLDVKDEGGQEFYIALR
ncbi:MAG: hypothetical protein ACI8X5_002003 [Planctomycetota bacterium]|jgi:hypothetical protein